MVWKISNWKFLFNWHFTVMSEYLPKSLSYMYIQISCNIKTTDKWSEWHWSCADGKALYSYGRFLTYKTHPDIIGPLMATTLLSRVHACLIGFVSVIGHFEARSTPWQCELSCWETNVSGLWRCHGMCSWPARVFGWLVCVNWPSHQCQDPEFASRTLHCNKIPNVLYFNCQWCGCSVYMVLCNERNWTTKVLITRVLPPELQPPVRTCGRSSRHYGKMT